MSQKGNNKYFDGSIVVNDSVSTRNVVTDEINGIKADDYLTNHDVPNPSTLKNFQENDGGLQWKGVPLVPPNEVQEDRPYTEEEITTMVNSLWDKYDGSVDDSKVDDKVDPSKPGGSTPSDWN